MTLTLTGRQRLALENVIRAKRSHNLDDAIILHGILKKVQIPEDEKKNYVRAALGGNTIVDTAALDRCPTFPVELERAEAMKLKTCLDEWRSETGVSTDDIDWYVPLNEALTEAAKYKKQEAAG